MCSRLKHDSLHFSRLVGAVRVSAVGNTVPVFTPSHFCYFQASVHVKSRDWASGRGNVGVWTGRQQQSILGARCAF